MVAIYNVPYKSSQKINKNELIVDCGGTRVIECAQVHGIKAAYLA